MAICDKIGHKKYKIGQEPFSFHFNSMSTKKRILIAFEKSGMTQETFCEKAKISRSTLNRWAANPDGEPVQGAKIKTISRALGVSVAELTEEGILKSSSKSGCAELDALRLESEKVALRRKIAEDEAATKILEVAKRKAESGEGESGQKAYGLIAAAFKDFTIGFRRGK